MREEQQEADGKPSALQREEAQRQGWGPAPRAPALPSHHATGPGLSLREPREHLLGTDLAVAPGGTPTAHPCQVLIAAASPMQSPASTPDPAPHLGPRTSNNYPNAPPSQRT